MAASPRLAATRARLLRSMSPAPGRRFITTNHTAKDEPWPQRTPLGGYYEDILRDPIPYPFNHKPEEPPSTADPKVLPPSKRPQVSKKSPTTRKPDTPSTPSASTSPPVPTPPPKTAAEKARIVFGSRLLGPAEQADRLALKKSQSSYIAGVLVPPRPDEPDNCCMSGCVNCVWDRYRDDMEEWSAQKNEAQRRLKQGSGTMDSDGGGSETNWGVKLGDAKITKDMWEEDVFKSVPVGIREFMKQEKRLKEKHEREGTLGG
ncbi:Oxidoreductase-like protein [Purpureocillium lavendulum]|uniref:Oxidoreductase-like protein n=1 Tax=Purpureocillium lavendulum TaxID=1247861 RepID=A0AB34FL72_9HYPO|nr:Oxidoreductase-like protein [Purpureocillium lavendulum]